MKQRELWEGNAIVRDPERSRFYLMLCMRILEGKENGR